MIAIGSDHAGIQLKAFLIQHLQTKGYDVKDFGANSTDSVDYPDYAQKIAMSVIHGNSKKGILICGTGLGVSIAANKVPGIRAALCTDPYMAKLSRKHNDANILALGEWIVGKRLAAEIVDVWLNTEFEGVRHQTRIEKIEYIEKNFCRGNQNDG